ncbi:hypothetical protein MHK_008618, partial [Candidatus Magnetomorum sp. HK-1]
QGWPLLVMAKQMELFQSMIDKMNRIIFFLIIVIWSVGCNDDNFSIYDWQLKIKQNKSNIKNIFLHQENKFYFSLNKDINNFYVLYFKNLEEYKIKSGIESWIEVYNNGEKIILDAGYAVNQGIYFKQTEVFNEINFVYRISGSNVKRFKFKRFKQEWKYI